MTLEDVARDAEASLSKDRAERLRGFLGLVKAMDDADPEVNLAAQDALRKFTSALAGQDEESDEPKELPQWVCALGNFHPTVVQRAVWELVDIGGPAVRRLEGALKDPNQQIRERAAEVLGHLDAEGNPRAQEAVKRALKSEHPGVKDCVRKALKALGRRKRVCDDTDRMPKKDEKPPIRVSEIAKVEAELALLHEPIVQRVQMFVDDLAGRRGESEEENKAIASAAYNLARRHGVDLLWEDQPVYIRWRDGIFDVRTTDGCKKTLVTSAIFPQLTARAKLPTEKLGQHLSLLEQDRTVRAR